MSEHGNSASVKAPVATLQISLLVLKGQIKYISKLERQHIFLKCQKKPSKIVICEIWSSSQSMRIPQLEFGGNLAIYIVVAYAVKNKTQKRTNSASR